MQRFIDFSGVTDYDLYLGTSGLTLKISQGGPVTNIHTNQAPKDKEVATLSPYSVQEIIEHSVLPNGKSRTAKRSRRFKNWTPGEAKLTKNQVIEIRQLWPEILKEHGSKNKAYKTLGNVYGCSPANIRLIIQGKTWTNI